MNPRKPQRIYRSNAGRLVPILGAAALAVTACSVEDVDRTQPNKVEKCLFFEGGCSTKAITADRQPTEFYYNQTVIDVPATSRVAFVGDTNFQITNRVVFDIQEDQLFVYRSFPWIDANDPAQTNQGDESLAPIAIFPIESHFDVIREYNAATGEQTNVIVENTTDRPWYQRDYMRVNWHQNLVGDVNFTMTSVMGEASYVIPQEDGSRDLGKESTKITPDYIDFVQHITLGSSIIPGSEIWFGFPIPTCWLFSESHSDCQGGVIKVRNSFAKVEDSSYQPLDYSDKRLGEFGAFRTERHLYDDEYGIVEGSVRRLANRWNLWNNAADCYDKTAEKPYGACQPSDLRTIVFHLAEEHPAHLKDAALEIGKVWDDTFRAAVTESTGFDAASIANHSFVRVCPNNPVVAGDPAECGEVGTNPQIGDLRYSFLYYVPEQHASSPLGFGPSNVDPLTGEIISATAYFYGAPARWLSRRTLDMFKVQAGLLEPIDLGNGIAVDQRIPEKGALTGFSGGSRFNLDRFKEIAVEKDFDGKGQRLREIVNSGESLHDPRKAKMKRLKESGLDAYAVTDEMKQAFGLGVIANGQEELIAPEGVSSYLGENLWGLYDAQQNFLRRGPGGRHVHLAEEYLEERYLALFKVIEERFMVDGVLNEEAALDFVESQAFIDTQLHEVGHTLGMMHNFAGSGDALNFGRDYWRMRAAAGMVEGKRPRFEFDVEDEAVYQQVLEEGLRPLQSSTSMEYASTYGDDTLTGSYDKAFLKYVYFDTVEVFDTDHPNVNITRERARLLERGALHYLYLPELVSDAATYEERVDAMYQRKTVNFRSIEENPLLVEAPFRFCGDRYAGAAADCERWDQGVDPYERTMKKVLDYENYYWLNAFKRDRLAFGTNVFGYVSRLYNRTYKPMLDQYKHWVNEEFIVRGDEQCVWYEDGQRQATDDPRYLSPACGLAGFVGAAEALNALADVVATPDVGCYARLQRGCYETTPGNVDGGGLRNPTELTRVSTSPAACETHVVDPNGFGAKLRIDGNSPYTHLEDTLACTSNDGGDIVFEIRDANDPNVVISEPAYEIALGMGKPSRTLYDREEYGLNFYWKPTVMGSWWEKWMAVKALYDPYTDFIGVDASSDTASFLINMETLFGDDVHQVVAGVTGEAPITYGRVMHQGEVKKVPLLDLFGRPSLITPQRGRDAPVDPDQEYTFRLLAMMNAAFQSSYITDNYEFSESLRAGRSFSLAEVELPDELKNDPDRFQSLVDPVTGEVWWAVRVDRESNGVPLHSPAYEVLKKTKNMFYVGGEAGPGLDLLPGVADFQPRGELRFLNIMRATGVIFGSGNGSVSAGDIGF